MVDFYIEDPSRLQGQPKRTIGDYVASNGILVPRRFDSLKDARASDRPFIARSEHVQDYGCVSGLLDSPLSKDLEGIETEAQLKETVFKGDNRYFIRSRALPEQLCRITGQPLDDFLRCVSYSFWELVPGYNRMVVADSSINGRHHIITTRDAFGKRSKIRQLNYSIVDNGEVKQSIIPLSPGLKFGLPELIANYEAIRSLGNFDPNHCPIMEFQTRHGRNYFLQYHRTRNFNPSTFTLNGEREVNQVEALFVRGATPKEGFIVNATVSYFVWNTGSHAWTSLPDEDASFDPHYSQIIPELNARKRRLQLTSKDSAECAFMEMAIGHLQRTKLFKPEVSVIIGREDILTRKELGILNHKSVETGQDQKIPLHIVSDGRKAYLTRL